MLKSSPKLSHADLISYLENLVPSSSALPQDNSGLQVGNPNTILQQVLITLDVTEAVVDEAISSKIDFILSHHPLIFQSLSRINTSEGLGRILAKLMAQQITVYSAHTSLDASREGVSIVLAKSLGVRNSRFLTAPDSPWLKKLVVFVPESHVDQVRAALAQAGAGVIGDYSLCSFALKGTGTFLGGASSSPTVGEKGVLEKVEEIRLEIILPEWNLAAALSALKGAHPYEEVAYDVYPLENRDVNYGFGAIGDLKEPVSLRDFVRLVQKKLGGVSVGFVQGPQPSLRRVAVCGGSGGALVPAAYQQGAQVFVTGEMKYHAMLEYQEKLSLVITGHYASEAVIVPPLANRLRHWLSTSSVQVLESKITTNPLQHL